MTELNDTKGTRPLRIGALVLAVLGVFPLAAVIQWAPVLSWLPLAAQEWLVSGLIAVALFVALARLAVVHRALDGLRAIIMRRQPGEFCAWLILITAGGAVLVSWYCYSFQPIGGDEMAQRFQARLLNSGRVSGVAESDFEFFSGIQTANIDGRWFSQFPIGGALALAVGGLLRMHWLVNPLLAGWTSILVYRFASRTGAEPTARIAALLFATSPFVLLMSGSQMNHVGSLAFMMLALSQLPIWLDATEGRTRNRAALAIGFGAAMSALFRPYDAVLFAIAIGLFQLFAARRDHSRIRSFAWQLLGGAIPMIVLLVVNWKHTGHPLLFRYDALNGELHRPGFHVDPTGNQFTPAQGIHHISAYLLLLNASLFAGPIPAVLLVVVALALAPRASRWDYLSLGLIAALLAGYALYWAESFFVGPRFLYMGVPIFVAFAARLPDGLRRFNPAVARVVLPVMVALAWLLPAGIAAYQGAWSAFKYTRDSRPQLTMQLEAELREAGLEHALVFVHESWHGRLTARLRAIGAPALTAEQLVREFDACALQAGLDVEDPTAGPPSEERWKRVVRRAMMAGPATLVTGTDGYTAVALANGRLHPACGDEWEADRNGSVPLDRFLMYESFDETGRLAGNVVFARDFGERNHKLLQRFGDRTWYRYRPRKGPNDMEPVFVPYFKP